MEKLIRDNIVKIVEKKGENIETYIATKEVYNKKLLDKVLEESLEIVSSKNDIELKEEIADLYEVIDTILKIKNFSKKEIIDIQKKKRKEKGGFNNMIIYKY